MKKRIVSFLLALVMAVSLLPVSAFADDNNNNTTVDIGTDDFASGSISAVGTTTIDPMESGEPQNVYLKKIDASVSAIENESDTWNLYADEANVEVLLESVADRTSEFVSVAKRTYTECINTVTLNEGVSLSSAENVEHLLLMAYDDDESFFFIIVEWAKPVSVLYTIGDSTENISAAVTQIGTTTLATSTGGIYLVSLPENAKINLISFFAPEGATPAMYGFYNKGGIKTYVNALPADITSAYADSENYLVDSEFGSDNASFTGTQVFSSTLPTEYVKGFMIRCWWPAQATINILYVQKAIEVKETDKTALNAAIASVTGENAAKYFQSDDRWNGNTTSENGFWSDMLPKLTAAQTVAADNTASQTEVDAAAASLQAAIDNLISRSNVNATALYEALNTDWRWNPGNSLQEGWPENTLWKKPSADNCTPLSWQPYAKAVKDGQALLDKLYENGKPTDENTDAKQETVDRLAAAADAHKLVNKEAYAAAYDKYMAAKPEAEALLKQYDPAQLTESDYTADSWKVYADAYAALEADVAYRVVGGTTEDYAMLKSFSQHMTALKNAYRQLTSATDVTVSFTYINNFSALYPSFGGTSLYTNGSLTLAAGSANLLGAYNAANITLDTSTNNGLPGATTGNNSGTNPRFALYINGSHSGNYHWGGKDSWRNVQLHNGDNVRLVRLALPMFISEDSSGLDSSKKTLLSAEGLESIYDYYTGSRALIDMTAPGSAKVGDKAKFSATVTGANTTNLGQSKSAAGITLFISDPSETEALSQPTHKTTAATGADGNLQYVFTRPGWYTVAMFNVTPDDYTFKDIYGAVTVGTYYSQYVGDYALIHVTAADDTDALLKQYRTEKAAEAKAYFDSFHDYDFTAADYAAFKAQYETLTANLQKATDLTALMNTYDADFARLKELGAAVIDHAAVIAGLRQNLSYLPDDLNDLNANYKQLVQDIQTVYGGLNSYQKKLLSANETKRLDAVAKINAESLTALAVVKLEADIDENQMPRKADNGNPYFGWPNLKWVVTPNVDGTVPNPTWAAPSFRTAKAGDHAFIRYYLDTTDAKYWPVWSVDGGTTWNLMEPQTLVTPDAQKTAYDGYYLAEYVIPDDVVDGSTITFKVKMVSKTEYQAMTADSEEAVTAAKSAALSRLETLRSSLGTDAEEAYQAGKNAIQSATSVAAVESAYQNAVRAMKDVATGFGKVHVIVENTTFTSDMWPKNKEYWEGTLVDTWVDLEYESTMMTCIVAALDKFGYKQIGAENNYISSINGLAAFDGNAKSGWMGTLNDWFTNYGFGAFSVAEGDLSDGDVIRVMYTNNTTNDNAGGDLGGTWGNKNTTLSDLTVSGGQLLTEFTPGQSGGTYEYTLAIDSAEANIQVTPTAANKNYLTKIFLNEKVTDNTEGFSFYKRTQSIPVKAGDVIYVGCGENGWPTMNGSGQRGTWYVLRVIDVNADASAVTGMINDLPEVSSVKYGNYQLYMNAVAAARASFNALSKEQQKVVADSGKLAELEKLEAAIAQFRAIDEVKDQLDKLPGAGDLTIEDQEAVKAAKDAYDKLTPEQKAELTGMEIDKMGELTTRMDEIIKENPTPTPTPGGNTGNNSSAKNPYQKDNGKDVKSGNTGDAGITLYVGMGLVAVLACAVIVTRKRKEN